MDEYSCSPSASPPRLRDRVQSSSPTTLSVKELKAAIVAAGLTYDDCIEKVELEKRLSEAQQPVPEPAPASHVTIHPECCDQEAAPHREDAVPAAASATKRTMSRQEKVEQDVCAADEEGLEDELQRWRSDRDSSSS